MKIEIGESLMLSYLKHIKRCILYQANWKASSNWDFSEDAYDNVLYNYNIIVKQQEFYDIFKSELSQLIKQSEIDVIGIDENNKIYTSDIAFHENGLNYGSKIETKNRVFKKLLRTYLTLLAYFPNRKYELIFASPKVNKSTEEIIKDYFNVLNNNFLNENVIFEYISNEMFKEKIFIPTIEKTKNDSDTGELFLRAIKLSNLFEVLKKESSTQNTVIENEFVCNNRTQTTGENKLPLEFIPNDEKIFKRELLKTKKARRIWYYSEKLPIEDIWNASNFTLESNLRGNIYSNNKVRKWKTNGLTKLKLEIIS